MKTKIVFACFVVVSITILALTIVFASLRSNTQRDISAGDPYSKKEAYGERTNRLLQMDIEKAQIMENIKEDPGKYEAERISEEDLSALREKLLRAEEEASTILQYFNQALGIVDSKYPGQFKNRISNLAEVDRNVIFSFVYTLKNASLSESEESLLKACISEKMLIITESDPLIDDINYLLGLES